MLTVFLVIVSLMIMITHAASAFFAEKLGRITPYVTVCLHILLIVLLLLMRQTLEILSIFFISSMIVYLSLFLISQKAKGREEDKK